MRGIGVRGMEEAFRERGGEACPRPAARRIREARHALSFRAGFTSLPALLSLSRSWPWDQCRVSLASAAGRLHSLMLLKLAK